MNAPLCNPGVSFTILGEPASKSNSSKIVTIAGHASIIKSAKAREYAKAFIAQLPAHARAMFEGPVAVWITVHYASERPDLDESVILDAMQATFDTATIDGKPTRVCVRRGVYANDRQVREKHVFHRIDRTNPRAEIVVKPLQPQPQGFPL